RFDALLERLLAGLPERVRAVLDEVPLHVMDEPDRLILKDLGVCQAVLCCGSAGVYNMLQPQVAAELGQMKVRNLLNTQASLIASANPGCSLQIQKHMPAQGRSVPLKHPIELLDMSIRGEKLPPHA
ncbi:MAG: (Fe-S)-binding protein, partial [Leptolyngbya sp. SIO4C5]|nr:(Fe-S)-binding protein [Leptolyngbya sp. SIO4C5]